jgi:stearoyl-CoA desaturase (delta-9 desaturase)
MYFLTLMGITVGFHRYLAHRSFKTSTTGRFILAVLGSMAAQGPVLHWVSNHRRHHRHSDQSGDPHSPNLHGSGFMARVKGFAHAHIGSMFAHEVTNFLMYSPDLVRDQMLMFVNRSYLWWVTFGIAFPAVVCGLISRSWIGFVTGLLWGGMVRMLLVHHAIWSITSLAHMFGAKRYAAKDESRNSFLLALVTGGEGWHNHHHAFPSAALFTDRLWKIDIGGIVIRLLHTCGLVWELHPVTSEMKTAKALHPAGVSDAENQ